MNRVEEWSGNDTIAAVKTNACMQLGLAFNAICYTLLCLSYLDSVEVFVCDHHTLMTYRVCPVARGQQLLTSL